MRIGVFGGSFDPIHIAHLLLAESALEQLQLDLVKFMPAAQSPLKMQQPLSAADRREMVHLAICGNERFELDDRELKREGISFTVDTLSEIKRERPEAELFLLVGADSLTDFARWRQPHEICQLARLAVAHRGGEPAPDFSILSDIVPHDQIVLHQQCVIEMPIMSISSSDIRVRIAKGKSIRYRVPAAVAAYIRSKNLYQTNL